MQAYRTLPSLIGSRALGSRVPALSLARSITTHKLTPAEDLEQLNKKRNLRPESPWQIYQVQLTSTTSLLHRASGVGLGLGIYALYIGYAVLPAVGIPFDSATIVNLVHELPEYLKVAGKTIVAAPFAYHFYNGLRHLAWDRGYFLHLKSAYQAAYAVLGATALTTLGLVLL